MANGGSSGTVTSSDLTAIATDPAIAPMLAKVPASQRQNFLSNVAGAAARHSQRKSGGKGGYQMPSRTEQQLPAERTRLWNSYYSVVRFQAAVSVASPVTTLTWNAGMENRAFSYRINDPLSAAGFDSTVGNATEADTNLVTAGQTIAGELVKVNGLSLMPTGETDIGIYQAIESNISVAISMNGDAQRYRLGRMSMIPGSGGTMGAGPTYTTPSDLLSSLFTTSGWSNGWPDIANYYPFPMPMIWSPSGETDSNFNVVLHLWRQVVIAETARAATAPVSGSTGQAAFAPPTAVGQFGTFVDIMVRLHSEQTSPRSVNQ